MVPGRVLPARGAGGYGLLHQSRLIEQQLSSVPDLKRRYETLAEHVDLRAEVTLRVGFLDSITMNWPGALDSLGRVPQLTDDPYLLYLSQYLIGSTHQRMRDANGAITAFERALTIVPNARSGATSLAALLLLSDRAADRERASALLAMAYSDQAPEDPWRLYGRGDARLWSAHAAVLRKALQSPRQ
jgi:tetratricopeptide (TPR) repeat protein